MVVGGRENERGRGAVAQERIEEVPRRTRRTAAVGPGHLGRIGVGLEPVEKLLAGCGDHVELRRMDMAIDETGDDEAALMMGDGHRRRQSGGEFLTGADRGNTPVLDDEQTVGDVLHRLRARRGIVETVQDRPAMRGCGHDVTSSRSTTRGGSSRTSSQFLPGPARSMTRKSLTA